MNDVVLGVDIGGTNTKFGLVDFNGTIYHQNEIPTHGNKSASDLIHRIYQIINPDFLIKSNYKLIGVGIGAPNGNYFTGMIQNPPNLNWSDLNIETLFEQKFLCDVKLTNDANAAALGEKYFGIAKKIDHFIMITLGTGLGSGIISNKDLIYGYDGFAGELGHISIDPNGRECNCGKLGCLEMYVSAKGIKLTIDIFLQENPENEFLKLINNQFDGKMIDDEYDKGNTIAENIYRYTGEKLGFGLAQAAIILNPEAFVFYGGLSKAGNRLFSFTADSMNNNLLQFQKGKIKLIQSALSDGKAGILGAASLILYEN